MEVINALIHGKIVFLIRRDCRVLGVQPLGEGVGGNEQSELEPRGRRPFC